MAVEYAVVEKNRKNIITSIKATELTEALEIFEKRQNVGMYIDCDLKPIIVK